MASTRPSRKSKETALEGLQVLGGRKRRQNAEEDDSDGGDALSDHGQV